MLRCPFYFSPFWGVSENSTGGVIYWADISGVSQDQPLILWLVVRTHLKSMWIPEDNLNGKSIGKSISKRVSEFYSADLGGKTKITNKRTNKLDRRRETSSNQLRHWCLTLYAETTRSRRRHRLWPTDQVLLAPDIGDKCKIVSVNKQFGRIKNSASWFNWEISHWCFSKSAALLIAHEWTVRMWIDILVATVVTNITVIWS